MNASFTTRAAWGLLLLPAVFLVEVILGGPLGVYRGLPVRYLLFVACGAVMGTAWLVYGRIVWTRIPAMLSIIAFILVNAIWVVVVPTLTGGRFEFALGEARAFAVLSLPVLVLGVVDVGNLRTVIRRLQLVVVITSALLALFQVVIWVVGTLMPDLQWVIRLGLVWLYAGAEDSFYVGPMPDGFFRVFWISSLWVLLAIFWLPVVRRTWLRLLLQGVLILGLVVTYSRGIWLGALVGFGAMQVARLTAANFGRMIVRAAAAAALVIGSLLGGLAVTGELDRSVKRVTSTASAEDGSIGVRLEQAHHLSAVWSRHELFGNGYGAYHPRYGGASVAPFSYENMPYAFLAKLGLVGVLVNGAFLLFWALTAWRMREQVPEGTASFLGGMTAFLIATMTNPMIINMVGMSILGCLLLQWASLQEPIETSR